MRRLFTKKFLVFLVVLLVGGWIAIQVTLTSMVRDALSRLEPHMVAPATVNAVRGNPFSGRITLHDLVLPQRRIVGVEDDVLAEVPLVRCGRLDVRVDPVRWLTDSVLRIEQIVAGGLELGAVVGPMNEVPRIDLVILPGILLGAIPETDGQLRKLVTYHLDSASAAGVKVRLVPAPGEDVDELVIEGIDVKASSLTNAVRGSETNEGVVDIAFKMPPKGEASIVLRIDSFDDLFRKARGRLTVKAERIPADQCNLMLTRLGRAFHYSSGSIALDLDADFGPESGESTWKRRRDEFKTVQLRVDPIPGRRMDAVSRRIMRDIRLYNGNTVTNYWFGGTLGRTKAGLFQFNLDELISTSPF